MVDYFKIVFTLVRVIFAWACILGIDTVQVAFDSSLAGLKMEKLDTIVSD